MSERDLGLGDGLDTGQGEAGSACSGEGPCAKMEHQKGGCGVADKSCVWLGGVRGRCGQVFGCMEVELRAGIWVQKGVGGLLTGKVMMRARTAAPGEVPASGKPGQGNNDPLWHALQPSLGFFPF